MDEATCQPSSHTVLPADKMHKKSYAMFHITIPTCSRVGQYDGNSIRCIPWFLFAVNIIENLIIWPYIACMNVAWIPVSHRWIWVEKNAINCCVAVFWLKSCNIQNRNLKISLLAERATNECVQNMAILQICYPIYVHFIISLLEL